MGLTKSGQIQPNTIYTQLFIDKKGAIIGKHQKLVPTIGERQLHTPGYRFYNADLPTEYGQISGLCCGENSNPFAVSVLASEYT